jgi:3-carboxy-cis,cis-muconate cycloisomerase
VPEAFLLISGAIGNLLQALDGIQIDSERMLKNLEITRGQILAEAAMMQLAPHLGRQEAHEHVRTLSATARNNGTVLSDVLRNDAMWLRHGDDAALELAYLGQSEQIVSRVVRCGRTQISEVTNIADQLEAKAASRRAVG